MQHAELKGLTHTIKDMEGIHAEHLQGIFVN